MLALAFAITLPLAQDPEPPERPDPEARSRVYVDGTPVPAGGCSAVLGTIAWFLFGTFYGWWVLFAMAFVVSLPFLNAYRAWRAKQRFMAAQGQKFANPQNADARFQIAEIYLQAGRWKSAHPYAHHAVEIASQNPVYDGVPFAYLRALGRSLYGMRRYAEAADVFQRALKAKSELGYFDALLGVSKCAYRGGQLETALEYAKHAVAEQESHLEPYFRWAQAAAALGKAGEADAARERFWRTALALPRYARQRRLWWRLAFMTFPLSRLIG